LNLIIITLGSRMRSAYYDKENLWCRFLIKKGIYVNISTIVILSLFMVRITPKSKITNTDKRIGQTISSNDALVFIYLSKFEESAE
jgi:hypothetical protein